MQRLRIASGLTLQAVGEVLGVSFQAVSAMEGGRISISATALPKLAALFDVPLDAFFRPIGATETAPELRRLPHAPLLDAFVAIGDPDLQRALLAASRALVDAGRKTRGADADDVPTFANLPEVATAPRRGRR